MTILFFVMKKSVNTKKRSLQKSMDLYVPKKKRGNHEDNNNNNNNNNNISDEDNSDNKSQDDEFVQEYDSEQEIEKALSSAERKKNYIRDHYQYIGYSNNHSIFQCNEVKFENGIAYRCKYKDRDSRLNFYHTHRWEKIGEEETKSTYQAKVISDYDLMLRKIIILAGHFNLSFSVIESAQFWDLLQFVFKFGQSKAKQNVDFFIRKPSHESLRKKFIEVGKEYHQSQIEAFSKLKYTALTLDAGTLKIGHFLDYAISSPLFDIKPYLYDADFNCDNTTDCIKSKTESIIKELHNLKVKIGSITGDNYPAQLYALCNWSKTSLWKESSDKHVKRTIFFSCFCHFLQLVASDVENENFIIQSVGTINQIKNLINSELYKIIGKVPNEVATRWFSQFNSLKFLLNKKNEIFALRDDLLKSTNIPDDHKQTYTSVLSQTNFEIITKYCYIMLPIYAATLYFDSNCSKVSEIVPIVFQIRKYWEDLACRQEYIEQKSLINLLLDRLKHRCFHMQDWPLLYLIYSLTPGGRVFARKILKKNNFKLEEEDKYDSCTGLDPVLMITLHDVGFRIEIDPQKNCSDDLFIEEFEDAERDNAFVENQYDSEENNVVQEKQNQRNIAFMFNEEEPYFQFNEFRSIDGMKLHPFERKMTDIEFLYEPGHYALLEQSLADICDRFDYTDKKEAIIQCYEFWIKASVQQLKIKHYTRENSYRIWNDFSIYKVGWKYLSKIAIQLLSAQAAETICERKISCQRISITNRRQNTKEDLIEARFRLSCNEPPSDGIVRSLKDLANDKYQKAKNKVKEMKQSLLFESINENENDDDETT